MFNFLKNLFGGGPSIDIADLIKNGAQIIDVRTRGEFAGGHVKGSINIPLQELESNIKKIKKDKPIITCCASGMRSGSAKSILSAQGFTVYNGGSWNGLANKI